jgi:hypothetical protein
MMCHMKNVELSNAKFNNTFLSGFVITCSNLEANEISLNYDYYKGTTDNDSSMDEDLSASDFHISCSQLRNVNLSGVDKSLIELENVMTDNTVLPKEQSQFTMEERFNYIMNKLSLLEHHSNSELILDEIIKIKSFDNFADIVKSITDISKPWRANYDLTKLWLVLLSKRSINKLNEDDTTLTERKLGAPF